MYHFQVSPQFGQWNNLVEVDVLIEVFPVYEGKFGNAQLHRLFMAIKIQPFLYNLGINLAVQGVIESGNPEGRGVFGNKSVLTQLAKVAAVILA